GVEWYPYPVLELLSGGVFVWILVMMAFILALVNWRKITWENVALFWLFAFFLFFTLKSRRYVEYLVPFALLWSAIAFRDSLGSQLSWHQIRIWLAEFFHRERLGAWLSGVYAVLAIGLLSFMSIHGTRNALKAYPLDQFAGAAEWLAQHTQAGDLIFHNDWDDFPILFFHSPANQYIIGLDPTFMYNFNPKLYWQWVNITTGKESKGLYPAIKKDFKASYVFVDWEHTALENNLRANPLFELEYQDDQAKIFKVL
ncbi:hypothetical protein HY224_00580, partial [Candidatus Uhrbacteria bacterium]|nr:hypothetical protein [Candidatus Uhrbacteria bacterium]